MSTNGIELFFVHTVDVTPYLGSGAYGDQYGPSQTVPGFLDPATRLVRDSSGAEVVSSATFYCDLAHVGAFPAGSLVTLPTGKSRVLAAMPHSTPGLDYMPEHLEVQLG